MQEEILYYIKMNRILVEVRYMFASAHDCQRLVFVGIPI